MDESVTKWMNELAQGDELAAQRLLAALGDESLRQIAIAKLEGYTNEEIAERLDCSLRTVKRRLGRVREIWGKEAHFMPN